MDTDKSPRLGSRYEVEALPTLILFHDGKVLLYVLNYSHITCVKMIQPAQVLERFIGYRTADVLEAEIRKVLPCFVLSIVVYVCNLEIKGVNKFM